MVYFLPNDVKFLLLFSAYSYCCRLETLQVNHGTMLIITMSSCKNSCFLYTVFSVKVKVP